MTGMSRDDCRVQVLKSVIRLNRDRILSRMRLSLGGIPSFMRAGANAGTADRLQRVLERMRGSTSTRAGKNLIKNLSALEMVFQNILTSTSTTLDLQLLQLEEAVKQSYNTVSGDGQMVFWDSLDHAGLDPREYFNNKHIMQIDKLSAYWRIPKTLVREARRKRSRRLFANMSIQYVEPFEPIQSAISLKGKAVSCHVHAEVQLITHYALTKTVPRPPRAIGTSKAACFLCHLFITHYGGFMVSTAHGRLFDQWTIPDLAEYSPEQVQHLRTVIRKMKTEIRRMASTPHPRRPDPLTSRHNLPELPQFSATPSNTSMATPNSDHPRDNDFQQPLISSSSSSSSSSTSSRNSASQSGNISFAGIQRKDSDDTELSGRCEPALPHDSRRMLTASVHSGTHSDTMVQRGITTNEEMPSTDLPLYAHVTPSKSHVAQFTGLDVVVEVEEPLAGRVYLQAIPQGDEILDGDIIDLEQLEVGSESMLVKKECEDSLVCYLRSENCLCYMQLQWE